tara:strand:+ start:8717 stop:8944 length:228 start_codon:yes stop_codon:yes gene_type:complete
MTCSPYMDHNLCPSCDETLIGSAQCCCGWYEHDINLSALYQEVEDLQAQVESLQAQLAAAKSDASRLRYPDTTGR